MQAITRGCICVCAVGLSPSHCRPCPPRPQRQRVPAPEPTRCCGCTPLFTSPPRRAGRPLVLAWDYWRRDPTPPIREAAPGGNSGPSLSVAPALRTPPLAAALASREPGNREGICLPLCALWDSVSTLMTTLGGGGIACRVRLGHGAAATN